MIDHPFVQDFIAEGNPAARLAEVPEHMFEAFDLLMLGRMIELLVDNPSDEGALMFAARAVFRHRHVTGMWEEGDHDGALWMLGSNARLPFLVAHASTLDAATLAPLLLRAWTEPNMVVGGPSFDYQAAVELFDRVCHGGVVLADDDTVRDRVLAERPVLYRGDDPMHREGSEPWDGLSWTFDRSVAERFATASSGRLWSIGFPDNAVPYAVIVRRRESEVILDPSRWPVEPVELDPVVTAPPSPLQRLL